MTDPVESAPVAGAPDASRGRAAVLVDYQNLTAYLRGRADARTARPAAEIATLLVGGLREQLAADGLAVAAGRAYADFPGLEDGGRAQHELYAHGLEAVFVPQTLHRNTTDLQMAVDALALAPEAEAVVLVSGDRDYAPVVRALLTRGRTVWVVAFKEHLGALLLEHAGGGRFVEGTALLPEGTLLPEALVGTPIETTTFAPVQDPAYEIDYDALEVIEKFFGQYGEIYLTPLLRRLSEEIGETDGHDPKSLVADLEECGAARLERRRGIPYDYTVLIINDEHPAVQEVRAELGTGAADDGLPFEDAAQM